MNDPTRPDRLEQRTMGDVAASLPGATSVFEWFDLDYCCNGDRSLERAASEAGIPLAALRDRLGSAATRGEAAAAARQMATPELIDHLVEQYHAAFANDLPELIRLAGKVEAVHQFDADAPIGLAAALEEFDASAKQHMAVEEQSLFPAMRTGDTATATDVIAALADQRATYPAHLHEIEELANGFALPPGACRAWQTLYFRAARFVDEFRYHVHLENNVLFPRFTARSVPSRAE